MDNVEKNTNSKHEESEGNIDSILANILYLFAKLMYIFIYIKFDYSNCYETLYLQKDF